LAIAGNKLYVVSEFGTNKTFVIDIDSQSSNYNTIIDTVPVQLSAYDVVSSEYGSYVYVSHPTQEGKVSIIDTSSDTLLNQIIIRGAEESEEINKNPRGMAVSGNILYVANFGDNTVTMINTQSNSKLNLGSLLISGGANPENMVVSPDGTKLYIVHSSMIAGSVEILGY
ncbi:YncE family protein, partial [Thermodesulfobacteriota bacterium]